MTSSITSAPRCCGVSSGACKSTAQPDLATYYNFLQANPDETKALLGDMLIGVTNFFRDREAFEALERDVIPNLVKSLEDSVPHREEVRIWSAGCSTGEEAYSLAMLVAEQLALDASGAKMQVFATDIDERAITHGRNGVYPEAIITDVPPQRLPPVLCQREEPALPSAQGNSRKRCCSPNTACWPTRRSRRSDLIVCRNLLIYLDREVQRDILQMFHFALRPPVATCSSAPRSRPTAAWTCSYRWTSATAFSGCVPAHPPYVAPQPCREAAICARAPRRLTIEAKAPNKVSFADIHLRALEKAAPPSVIVNNAGRYPAHERRRRAIPALRGRRGDAQPADAGAS